MIKKSSGRTKSGVALLFVVSVLGLLVLIGISFALNMLLARKEANNYLNSVKARYIAEAGIKKAVMDIRGQVTSSTYGNLKTYISGYVAASGTNVAFGGGKYTLTIISEEGKVNINTFDPEPNTPNTQLTILRTFLTDQQIANIIDYRDTDAANTVIGAATGNIEGTAPCKNRPFDTTQEIMIATGISKATYDAQKDKITVTKPIIRGGLLGKYYKGITNASPNVAIDHSTFSKKVVELGTFSQYESGGNPMPGTDGDSGDTWAETHDAEMAGGSALDSPGDFGMNYCGVIWTGYLEILPSELNTPIDFWVASDDGARFYINDGTADQLICDIWTDTGASSYPGDRNVHATFTFTRAGWYPIRLEYYDQDHYNSVQLKWKDPSSFWTAPWVPAERLGYDPPTEVAGGYDHAGMYTITATASVVESTATVATKQVTAVVEIFDTWTQTTREEFSSAWFNLQGDFSDGECFDVNWQDDCPTDEDYWDAGISKMHWEGAPQTTPDSVKLGYWDNFDEDPAFSSVMMKGYLWNRAWWGLGTLYVSYQDFRDMDGDGDNEVYLQTNTFEAKHFELNRYYFRPNTQDVFVRSWIQQPAPSKRIAWRGTGTLYTGVVPPPTTPYPGAGGKWIYWYDGNSNGVLDWVFIPPWTYEIVAPDSEVFPAYDTSNNPVYIIYQSRPWTWELDNIPPPGTYTYYQPETPPCGNWLFAKGSADDPPGGANVLWPYGFKTLLTDGHLNTPVVTQPLPCWPFGDTSEVRLYQSGFFYAQYNYPESGGVCTAVISLIGTDNGASSASYYSWVNGNLPAVWTPSAPNWAGGYPASPIFKFVNNNQYLGADWSDFTLGQHIIGGRDWPYAGAVTKLDSLWDNIRCIPASGYLVSAPCYVGSSPIKWGTISYSKMPGAPQTNVNLSYRKQATLPFPSSDSGWTAVVASGDLVGGTEPWIQYKAVLTSNAINRANYGPSSRTPALMDVNITYMPVVQIKYWKEGL